MFLYEVFHVKPHRANFGVGQLPKFPDDYDFVARLRATDLEQVFFLTNHIESDWTTNQQIEYVLPARVRSTSVDDVVRNLTERKYWRCLSFGWESLQKGGEER